ncbi:MFS transporter [Lysinibacillus sp. BW-2-10]|uniref:MFS transporter n=1 Tax=Lysinibacillus sp. BW-2-10 TaxID=2590030 RepID=UPI00117F0E75|nr:MFS transporter [Lysinibacillus sp. BW-2-10]TSI11748.1 MFS transporter [Lysinibacillus sp. BW-2-10]
MRYWRLLLFISVAELFAMSLWFSASAVIESLVRYWDLTVWQSSSMTVAVQIGFIIGAFGSSLLGLQDRYSSRKIFIWAGLFGAGINLLLIITSSANIAILLRLLTGIALAGIYPTAVKLISTAYEKQRGFAIGVSIAALTVGSAMPHLIRFFFQQIEWQIVIISSSILALFASLIMLFFVSEPRKIAHTTEVSFKIFKEVISNKPVMLANYGYFGHMWELYAMWTWMPLFLGVAITKSHSSMSLAMSSILAFFIIGIAGGVGSIIGGYVAERIGKTKLTIYAMAISATCAILIGLTLQRSIWLTVLLALIWGASVIADSGQFSAIITEFAQDHTVGTALAFQMAVGYVITIISINLITELEKLIGWQFVFTSLAIGPILGMIAMVRLQKY